MYRLIKADSRKEAIEKSGLGLGKTATISNLVVSYAGEGRYVVIPNFEINTEVEDAKKTPLKSS